MSFDIMFNNAVKLHENGKLDDAENIYRELLKTAPKNPDLLHLIGLIAHQKQAFSSAVDFISQAVQIKPDCVPFIFSLAHALQEWGKHFEALENYHKVTELQPDIPETWNNMGNIYRLNGKPNKAKECFEKALRVSPDLVVALNNLSLIHLDLGEINIAKEYLQKAIDIDPNYEEALFNLANIARNEKNFDLAINLYQRAVTINPNFARCFNSMGIAFERLEKFDDAKKAFENALNINPRYADALKNLANTLFLKGDTSKAENTYKKAIKIDTNLFDAYVNLGNLLQQQKRLEEALECYRKAIILNPKQPEVCNNLGLAVQELGDIEEAVGLFCNSLYLKPDLLQTKYNLALALYDMYLNFDKEKAIKIAENWVRSFKNDPIAKHSFLSLNGETRDNGAENSYLSEFFDAFALDFETTLNNLNYNTPQIIKNILTDLFDDKPLLKILDLGCGTGLCGIFLKPYALELIGVDLSQKMLEKAKEKHIYDILKHQDIITYLNQNQNFDLIVASDVFCYFANLSPSLASIANSLKSKGYVVFSVEQEENNNDYQIYPTGRYKHSTQYLEASITKAGLEIIDIKSKQIRFEKNESVLGIVAIARKA